MNVGPKWEWGGGSNRNGDGRIVRDIMIRIVVNYEGHHEWNSDMGGACSRLWRDDRCTQNRKG